MSRDQLSTNHSSPGRPRSSPRWPCRSTRPSCWGCPPRTARPRPRPRQEVAPGPGAGLSRGAGTGAGRSQHRAGRQPGDSVRINGFYWLLMAK